MLKTPPQSPDLNPIENVWGEIKSRLANHNFTNIEDFKRKLRKEWENIPFSLIQHLIYSTSRSLQTVIDARGYATKY